MKFKIIWNNYRRIFLQKALIEIIMIYDLCYAINILFDVVSSNNQKQNKNKIIKKQNK